MRAPNSTRAWSYPDYFMGALSGVIFLLRPWSRLKPCLWSTTGAFTILGFGTTRTSLMRSSLQLTKLCPFASIGRDIDWCTCNTLLDMDSLSTSPSWWQNSIRAKDGCMKYCRNFVGCELLLTSPLRFPQMSRCGRLSGHPLLLGSHGNKPSDERAESTFCRRSWHGKYRCIIIRLSRNWSSLVASLQMMWMQICRQRPCTFVPPALKASLRYNNLLFTPSVDMDLLPRSATMHSLQSAQDA